MKHSRFGLILLLSSGGLLACTGDPTSSFRDTGSRIIADPTVIFLDKGETTNLTLTVVDDQGNQLPSTFEAVPQSANASVVRDTTFLATTNGTSLETSQRFSVTGVDYVLTSIKVTAGTDTLTVPVSVVPKTTIAATISDTVPPLGQTITITAPPGISFSPTSTVSFGEFALPPAEVVVSADGSSISLVPPPNLVASRAEITDVVSVGSPTLTFTNTTTQGITTAEVVVLPGTLSTLTPAVNQIVTVTFNAATSVPPSDTAAVPVDVGGVAGTVLTRTPTTLTFLPPRGSLGPVTVRGVVLNTLPQFELTLSTPDTMTVDTLVPTLAGTAAAGTAPTIGTLTNLGDGGATYDAPDYVATADHFYKVVIASDGDYAFSLDWTVGSDIDMFICPSPGAIAAACNFDAATGNQPEATTATLTAGTYWIVAEDFGADAAGTVLHVTVTKKL